MLVFFVLASSVTSSTIPPPPSCGHMRYTYSMRGVLESEMPPRPISGKLIITMSDKVRILPLTEFVEAKTVDNHSPLVRNSSCHFPTTTN